MTAAIRVEGLVVRFGAVTAVDDLALEVHEGEVLGFLGPNGAGKTTTLRTLLDLERPARGRALVFGQEVRSGGGALRARIGYLPGDRVYFPWLTGRETLDLFARLHGGRQSARDAVLARLGFPQEALDRGVGTYSTGMRTMLGIAVALQHEPELAILDEPTSGLDPMVRDAFLELVRALRARGATVLLSSHVLAEVEACADRVALIHRGRLLLVAAVAELRRTRPRHVVLRFEDGREERRTHAGSPAELLAGLPRDGLVDLEIRPTGLDEIVRATLRGEAASGDGARGEAQP